MHAHEIANCIRKLKNNMTGGGDGIVGKLLNKNGGLGMVHLLQQLFLVIIIMAGGDNSQAMERGPSWLINNKIIYERGYGGSW